MFQAIWFRIIWISLSVHLSCSDPVAYTGNTKGVDGIKVIVNSINIQPPFSFVIDVDAKSITNVDNVDVTQSHIVVPVNSTVSVTIEDKTNQYFKSSSPKCKYSYKFDGFNTGQLGCDDDSNDYCCRRNITFAQQQDEDVRITYKSQSNGFDLTVSFRIIVVGKPNIHFEPAPIATCTSYTLIKDSTLRFTITNITGALPHFKVNGIEENINAQNFNRSFDNTGTFNLAFIYYGESIWSLTVIVVEINLGMLELNLPTDKVFTVDLASYCWVTNPESTFWEVKLKGDVKKYIGSSFQHPFHSIGTTSANAKLTFYYPMANKFAKKIYLQLYDPINGDFNITTNKTDVCPGDVIKIQLSVEFGSAVYYKFLKVGTAVESNVQDPKSLILKTEVTDTTFEFIASNPISSLTKELTITKQQNLEDIVVNLNDVFVTTNSPISILPQAMSGLRCSYRAQWLVDGDVLKEQEIADASLFPVFKHTFNLEGVYIVEFLILDTTFTTSCKVTVQNEIIFTVDNQIVTALDEMITIAPVFLSSSSRFSYQWEASEVVLSELSITNEWVNNVTSVPSINQKIQNSIINDFHINLTVRNSVSEMKQSVHVRVVAFTFSPLNESCFDRATSPVIKMELQLSDSHHELNAGIICSKNQIALPTENITVIDGQSNRFQVLVGLDSTGVLRLTCGIKNTEVEESIIYYVINGLDASVSNTSFMAGETISGEIANPIVDIPYRWYTRTSKQNYWTQISGGPLFENYSLTSPGDNYFLAAVSYMPSANSCHVTLNVHVNIDLVVEMNGNRIISGYDYFLPSGIELKLVASIENVDTANFQYAWQNNKYSFVTKNTGEYNYHTVEQETIEITVNVVIDGVDANEYESITVKLHFQKPLTGITVMVSNFISADNLIIDRNTHKIMFNLNPEPIDAVSVSANVKCSWIDSGETLDVDETLMKTKFTATIVFKYEEFGKAFCEFVARNSVSSKSKQLNFSVLSKVIPQLEIIDPKDMPGDISSIAVDVYNVTMPSNIRWTHKNQTLGECSTILNASPYQSTSCSIQTSGIGGELVVFLYTTNLLGNNVTTTIEHIQLQASITPTVVQVGILTNLTITGNVTGYNPKYQWKYRQAVVGKQMYFEIQENTVGKHELQLIVYNAISTQTMQTRIDVIDPEDFTISSNLGNSSSGNLTLVAGSTINFTIYNNNNTHVEFVWNIFPITGLVITKNNPRSRTVAIQGPDIPGEYVDVNVDAMFNGGLVKTKTIRLNLIYELADLKITPRSAALRLYEVFTIDVSWVGNGDCKIKRFTKSDCLSQTENVVYNLTYNSSNQCEVAFRTDAGYKCYLLIVSVANIVSELDEIWNYDPFSQIPIVIEPHKTHLKLNEMVQLSIDTQMDIITYSWFLKNRLESSHSEKLKIGTGSSINFTVPSDLLLGEYLVQVVAASQGRTRSAESTVLVTDNHKINFNSSLDVSATNTSDVMLRLNVKRYFAGLTYTWRVCFKGSGNNCSGETTIVGNGSDITYQFKKSLKEGVYLFSVVAGTLKTFEELIYFSHCAPKQITIEPLDGEDQLSRNRSHVMSNWFYSEVKLQTTCHVKYEWTFLKCTTPQDCSRTEQHQPTLLPGMSLVNDAPLLELPPRAFQVGVYKIHLLLTMGEYTPQVTPVKVHLTVSGSPPIPVIAGGLYRVIGDENEAILDASETIDPDANYGAPGNLTFKWEVPDISCFISIKNPNTSVIEWSVDNEILQIKKQCLQPSTDANDPYNHTLHVRRVNHDEIQSTFQKVLVVDGEAPLVKIECITCQTYKTLKYIPTRKIKMKAKCSNCIGQTSFHWKVKGQNDDRLVDLNEDSVLSPLNSHVLVLDENVLDGKQSYEIEVTAKIKGFAREGSTLFTLEYNTSPENGSCSFNPAIGEATSTVFTMSCKDWTDTDNTKQPLLYWLVTGDSEEQTVNSRGIQNNLDVLLPTGSPNNSYILPIEVWVQDSLGAHTVALKKSIIVTPSTGAVMNPVLFLQESVLPQIAELAEKKDLNQVTSLVVAASRILSDDTTGNESRTDVVKHLVNETAKMDPTSIVTIGQILHAFHAVKKSSSLDDMHNDTRSSMLMSMRKIMTLSKSFASQFISLESKSENEFFDLINNNIAFRVLKEVPENGTDTGDDDNDAMLQELYQVALKTTILGEKAKILKADYLTASLHRVESERATVASAKTVGTCSTSYTVNGLNKKFKELSEISECSSLNPYTRVAGQSSITSLTFQDTSSTIASEFSLSENTESVQVTIGVPVQTDLVFKQKLMVNPENMIAGELTNFTAPNEGWNSSAIHLVFNFEDLQEDSTATFYVQLALNTVPDVERSFLTQTFKSDSDEAARTLILQGRQYQEAFLKNMSYYFSVDHDGQNNVTIDVAVYISTCRFWNVTTLQWEGTGCQPTVGTTHDVVMCSCNHLTSFGSSVNVAPNKLDFTVLEKLDVSQNPVMLITCIVVMVIYIFVVVLAYIKDKKEALNDHIIPFIGSDDGFYQYEIRIKTGVYAWAGTSARVGIQIKGTSCTTKTRVFNGSEFFRRNDLDIFRISLDRSIGKIHNIKIWHDNSGADPSWYLERVVIRSLVNGEKFFFYCNKWIGTDAGDGKLEHEFHAADIDEMKKFSTIFFDILARGFSDYHLWLSVFERPKFSKFTRVQRVTCLVTFVFSWMAVNAAWFQIAPEGKVDLYIGFRAFSFEELFIGVLSALMVFPLNFLLLVLFRKSSQKQPVIEPLKIWKKPRRVMMDFISLDNTSPPLTPINDNNVNVDINDDTQQESILLRKKNVRSLDIFNFQDLDSDGSDDSDVGDAVCLQQDDHKSVIKNPFNISDDEEVLTLPRTFALHRIKPKPPPIAMARMSTILKQEPRSTSISHITRQDFLSKMPLKKTHSDGSDIMLITNAEDELIDSEFLLDQVGKPKELEKNISDFEYEYERVMTTNDDHRTRAIKKNEELMAHLQIPDIIELDPVTRWTLPYWCVYVGFTLCALVSIFSIIVVLTYGQQFGYHLSIKWLKALAFGFLEDCFLTYPFLLVLVAAMAALFVKPLDLDVIDHYDFITCPSGAPQPANTEQISPPTGYALEAAIADGRRRKNTRKYAKDILFQLLLLWLVVSIYSVHFVHKNHPYEMIEKEKRFMMPLLNQSQNYQRDYWSWLESTFIDVCSREVIETEWELASTPVIQQVRVGSKTCPTHAQYANITHCATDDFSQKPHPQNGIHITNPYGTETQYGFLDNYPSYGNVWVLPSNRTSSNYTQEIQSVIASMKQQLWIDGNTRLLSHYFALYNPNTNLYAFYHFMIEVESTSFVKPSMDIHLFPANFFLSNLDKFVIFCLVSLTIVMMVLGWKTMKKILSSDYKSKFLLNMYHLAIVLVTVTAIILQVVDMTYLQKLKGNIDNGFIVDPVRLRLMVRVREATKHVFAVSIFLIILRCLLVIQRLNHFQKKLQQLLKASHQSLLTYMVMHLLVSIVFANFGYSVFGSQIDGFYSYGESLLSTLLFRWWKPGGKELRETSLGMLWAILYTAYWFILAVNMFRVVLINEWLALPKKRTSSSNFWKSMWRTYFPRKSKKTKKVQFSLTNKVRKLSSSSSQDLCSLTQSVQEISKDSNPDLPPLPYSSFELGSNLISALADLDRMITAETWEEEALHQISKKLGEMDYAKRRSKQKRGYKMAHDSQKFPGF